MLKMTSAVVSIPSSDAVAWQASRPVEPKFSYNRIKWTSLQSNSASLLTNVAANFRRNASPEIVDWSRGFLAAPYVISTQIIGANATAAQCSLSSPFYIGLKPGGWLNAVDHFDLLIGGSQRVGNSSPFNNVYANLRYIFSASTNFHRTIGGRYAMGTALPDEEILAYQNALPTGNAATGILACNAVFTPANNGRTSAGAGLGVGGTPLAAKVADTGVVSGNQGPYGYNAGLYSRMINLGQNGLTDMTLQNITTNTSVSVARGCYVEGVACDAATSTAGTTGPTLSGWAIIPLAMMGDQFRSLGMRAWVDFTLNVYFNSVVNARPVAGGKGYMTSAGTPSWNQNILMVSQAGCTATTCAANEIATQGNILSCGIVFGSQTSAYNVAANSTSPGGGFSNPSGGQQTFQSSNNWNVELWFPTYELQPEQYEQFLASPREELAYSDFQYLPGQTATAAGSQATYNLGNLISPRGIFMILKADTSILLNNVPVSLQCVSYEPMYPTAKTNASALNLTVNSEPIYASPINYSYVDFCANFMERSSILNANLIPDLTAGLYSKAAYDVAPIYYFDLSRYVYSGQSAAILITFQNNSPFTINADFFVEQWQIGLVSQTPSQFAVVQQPVPR